eukprot:Pgem_evm1s2390
MTNLTGSQFTMPTILTACDESFETNLCLFCASYRNVPVGDLSCATHLDSDQLVFDSHNTGQITLQYLFDIVDAIIVGIAVVWIIAVVPYIYNMDDSISLLTKMKIYSLALAVFWNAASWYFHGKVHGYVAKPMRATTL